MFGITGAGTWSWVAVALLSALERRTGCWDEEERGFGHGSSGGGSELRIDVGAVSSGWVGEDRSELFVFLEVPVALVPMVFIVSLRSSLRLGSPCKPSTSSSALVSLLST